jgi:scyllo-inositol 2-dehydrogenase (NADP+)
MIRVGLVGYGLAGKVFHAPLIRACQRMMLAAVLTTREAPARVATLDELIERSDLVVIASPNQTHFPIAKAALDAGRHVIVDKPFAVALAEADALIALAERKGRVLSVFHNRRWDSDFLTVLEILPRLGEVMLFEAHWDRFRPQIKEGWRERLEPGGGVLSDLGPHLIDQALQLFGKPEAIDADIGAQRPSAAVDDYFDVTLHYGRCRVRLCCSTLVATPRPRFAIHGTQGSYVKQSLDPQEAQLKAGLDPHDPSFGVDEEDGIFVGTNGKPEPVATSKGNYRAFYEAIADSILNRAPPPVAARDARDGLALISLARQAATLGSVLPVPDASSREASIPAA